MSHHLPALALLGVAGWSLPVTFIRAVIIGWRSQRPPARRPPPIPTIGPRRTAPQPDRLF